MAKQTVFTKTDKSIVEGIKSIGGRVNFLTQSPTSLSTKQTNNESFETAMQSTFVLFIITFNIYISRLLFPIHCNNFICVNEGNLVFNSKC